MIAHVPHFSDTGESIASVRRPGVPRWTRAAAALMVAALQVTFILPIARWLVAKLLGRLSVISYLAGSDHRQFTRHLIKEIRRKRARGELSAHYLAGWVSALLETARRGPARRRRAAVRLGKEPPAFAILSPSAACNLRCTHCYAATGVIPSGRIPFAGLDRLVDGLDAAGTSLVIISGGEPLAWREGKHDLFELVARHPQMLFIVFSNATLLDDAVASRMRELGNLLPLLSLEGLETETDEVRGPGVYRAVRSAMDRLSAAGVLFGVSVTASPHNWELLASKRFYKDIVDGAGASFVWVLDLAPLGRAENSAALDAQSREALQQALNREIGRGRLVVSFLHTPTSPTGCFGAHRFDGFFYLDWDTTMHRCVYQPAMTAEFGGSIDRQQDVDAMLDAFAHLAPCPLRDEGMAGRNSQESILV